MVDMAFAVAPTSAAVKTVTETVCALSVKVMGLVEKKPVGVIVTRELMVPSSRVTTTWLTSIPERLSEKLALRVGVALFRKKPLAG